MTDIDYINEAISKLLDGNGKCPGQTQEGKKILGVTILDDCRYGDHQSQKQTNYRFKFYDDPLCWICGRCKQDIRKVPEPTQNEWNEYVMMREQQMSEIDKKLEANKLAAQARQKHQAYELGAREFTLTYSPKWMDDTEARYQMKRAIEKLIKYYKNEIIELRAVGEVGSNGLSHVHCFYKLVGGLKITDKNFKRAWSYWNPKKPQGKGFEGGHHQTVRVESDFQGYIEKDIDDAWLDVHEKVVAEGG